MGKTLLVGDVHGCRDELLGLLDLTRFTTGDQLVLVGDVLARGPDSIGVLAVIRQTGALFVRGNHEEKLLSWRRARARGEGMLEPLGRLHASVAEALAPDDWALLSYTPLWLDLPDHVVRVVHAGVVPGVPIEEQKKKTLLRIRSIGKSGEPRSTRDGSEPWGKRYRGPPHVVFGHNAAEEPQLHRWATGLDTGCVYGGRLTALVLEAKEHVPLDLRARRRRLVSVPARRTYYAAPGYAAR